MLDVSNWNPAGGGVLQFGSRAFQIQENKNENPIRQLNKNLKSNRGKEGAKSDLVPCFHKTHTFDMPLKIIRKPLLDSTSHNLPVYQAPGILISRRLRHIKYSSRKTCSVFAQNLLSFANEYDDMNLP